MDQSEDQVAQTQILLDQAAGGDEQAYDDLIMINHEISLVGYGKDAATGKEYWVGRNSWGTYWGEQGFFRIAMRENNLGIITACTWATPKL